MGGERCKNGCVKIATEESCHPACMVPVPDALFHEPDFAPKTVNVRVVPDARETRERDQLSNALYVVDRYRKDLDIEAGDEYAQIDGCVAILANHARQSLATPSVAPEVSEAEKMAFVCGAKWWEVRETGATMWPSDQTEAYAAAEAKILAFRKSRAALAEPAGAREVVKREVCRECDGRGFYTTVAYDKSFGDDKLCVCGHPYYRHFDTYDEMLNVGCKYCECQDFRATPPAQGETT